MSELDNGYINSNFEQENEEKQNQESQDSISYSRIGAPIKLVEVKSPLTTSQITFPKPVTFSEPVTGTKNEEIFDNRNSAVFSENKDDSYFINKSGMKDFDAMDEHADRWAAYRTESEPKKRNWIPVIIAVALVLGVVSGFSVIYRKQQSANKESLSALPTKEATVEVPETIAEAETQESVEEIVTTQESTETVEVESTESTQESSFTREPLVMEDSTVKTFVEDTENIGYGVTYDAERAEQRLDALEALYEQMPER